MNASPADTIRRYLDDHGGQTEATVEHLLTTFGYESSDESARPQIVDALEAVGVRVEPSLEGLSDHDAVVVATTDISGASDDSPMQDDEAQDTPTSRSNQETVESAGSEMPHPAASSEEESLAGGSDETEQMDAGHSPGLSGPQRVCRKCSAISDTDGDFCPHCGTSYQRNSLLPRPRAKTTRWSRRRKTLTLVIPLLLLVAGIGVGIYLKIDHDDQVAAERRAAERKKEEAAQRRKAEEARQKKAEEELQTAIRDSSVKQLETAITKDARERVGQGVVDGPIKRTECSPNAGADPTDPDVSSATYECIAVNKETGTQIEGPRFSATIDFDSGDIRWHLGE